MADMKYWDMIKIVLDNCHLNRHDKNNNKYNASFDFTVLDPPIFKELKQHPLIKIANSGQEKLLTHETIQTLLRLKWRRIPRLFYYLNLSIHFVFLVLFTVFSLQLVDLKKRPENNNNQTEDDNYNSVYYVYLMVILSIIGFIMLIRLALGGVFTFLFHIETWFEVVFVALAYLSLHTNDLPIKTTYCTIVLVTVYFHFALLIQKLKFFGAYVLAFKGTIKNSIKFFPVFFLIFLGFIFSFRLRSTTSDLSLFNGTSSDAIITGIYFLSNKIHLKY